MKVFKYKYEKLLKYKSFLREKKEREFQKIASKVSFYQNKIYENWEILRNRRLPDNKENLIYWMKYYENLYKEIDFFKKEIEKLKEEFNKKREEYIKAKIEEDKFKKLKENYFKEYIKEFYKEESKEIDDLTQSRGNNLLLK